GDAAFFEQSHELSSRRLGERLLLARLRAIEQGSVFGHHALEQFQAREVLPQIVEFPARHHNQPPPRTTQSFERRHSLVIYAPVMSQRAVVTTSHSVITHAFILQIAVGESLLTGGNARERIFRTEYS